MAEGTDMRHIAIIGLIISVFSLVSLDAYSFPPNPYQAPDPIAWGSKDGASGALCSFAPTDNSR